ncbi:YfhD family protein [Radiobacillus kanasensis]|uniref:YfhD family protein n=1 Tax=Radiobacillus kanasensis TaxID=2844358 RepID=UPI001E57777C|nr:YfhD family protein [Radiobacillus kanasensis]UFT98289.1 YfhD family protein [Radiobacillus kanasensis]
MGRDDHNNKSKSRHKLAQTPKYEKTTDGIDVEFSKEFADNEDMEAQARSKAADSRAHKK